MSRFDTTEIEDAFTEFRKRGVERHDWAGWADLFTDDALYEEHFLGNFHGRSEISSWIQACMAEYKSMTLWIDWHLVADDKVAFYIWNNLPDPTGTGKRYGFPNTTVLGYAGEGKWNWEADFYNPADAERVWTEWFTDGGRLDTPPDHTLQGIADWQPAPSTDVFPEAEVREEFDKYRERGRIAVATGDWDQWADQFTDDAKYYEHHYGRFDGQDQIRAWITETMGPFPSMEFPSTFAMIDGNRVVSVIPNVLPDATPGDRDPDKDRGFDVFVQLHYAGGGKWSYEEDVYNPKEAQDVVEKWIAEGGKIG